MVQEIKQLPYPLENLDKMGMDTFEVLKGEKPLILSLGSGAAYYLDFYLHSLGKYGVKRFDVAKVKHGDELPEYKEIKEPSKPINPIGCSKIIIFDNSTRSFKTLAGAYKYLLPRCLDWGIYEVYAFIITDENGGSNSTALPVYQHYKIPYEGSLSVFRKKSKNLFEKLDNRNIDKSSNKKLTELISTWASSIHSSTNLKDKIDKGRIDVERMLYSIIHRP
jgi:hypothetical protein